MDVLIWIWFLFALIAWLAVWLPAYLSAKAQSIDPAILYAVLIAAAVPIMIAAVRWLRNRN